MIEFRDLSFTYWGQERPALRDVTLRIDDGEFVLVAGTSGSGKSSLCRCVNGLIPHFHGGLLRGRVSVDGLDTVVHQPKDLATRVGMVFQDPENQLIAADVERDIAFGLENQGCPVDDIHRRIGEVLELLGISRLRRSHLATLSGGQKQLAAIAAALVVRPRVLVLDEPTSELDPVSAEALLSAVAQLRRELGITVVLVEHRLERVVKYVDRIVLLRDGSVAADGTPERVLGAGDTGGMGLGLPPAARLAVELRRRGLWQGSIPLSVDDACRAFGPLLRGRRAPAAPVQVARPGDTLVAVEGISFGYDGGSPVLKDVTHAVPAGRLLAVMGRNGSGKTTLVKHYNGLLRPQQGRVLVGGVDTAKTSVAALARSVGLVFQNPNDHLFAETVDDEILFTLRHLGLGVDESRRRLGEALALFGLERYREHYPRSLSGGERQRVALASVVAARPRVLVLDEPTRGLEHDRKDALMGFLRRYAAEENAVVLVTHDVETVAEHADCVLLLDGGHVAGDGTTRDVLARSESFRPDMCRLAAACLDGGGDAILTVEEMLEVLD
ncbi:MAG: energy-coupling factor transporter ATPase [Dehalococcoidia bacterium]|nr:energy-coupling factor transporter ATPase [Dehalococcoidia bacterium]